MVVRGQTPAWWLSVLRHTYGDGRTRSLNLKGTSHCSTTNHCPATLRPCQGRGPRTDDRIGFCIYSHGAECLCPDLQIHGIGRRNFLALRKQSNMGALLLLRRPRLLRLLSSLLSPAPSGQCHPPTLLTPRYGMTRLMQFNILGVGYEFKSRSQSCGFHGRLRMSVICDMRAAMSENNCVSNSHSPLSSQVVLRVSTSVTKDITAAGTQTKHEIVKSGESDEACPTTAAG